MFVHGKSISSSKHISPPLLGPVVISILRVRVHNVTFYFFNIYLLFF